MTDLWQPNTAVSGYDPCPQCGALPCDWVDNPHQRADLPTNWELTNAPVEGDLSETIWQVHRVNGGYNDREWTLIATGATAWQALGAAISRAEQVA